MPNSRQDSTNRLAAPKLSARNNEEEETKLPPLTPSVQSVKSTNAPSIQPRKAMEKMSNKKILKNAITLVVLAGHNE